MSEVGGPVTGTTAIAKIKIWMNQERENDAQYVAAYEDSDGQRHQWSSGPPFNLTSSSFRELDRRVEVGTATLEFITQWGTYAADNVPDWLIDFTRQRNPFNRVQATITNEQEDILENTVWYKRSATAPTRPTALDDGTIDGITHTADSVMAAAGWSKTPPTGNDTLYYMLVTYSVAAGVPSAEGTAPDTDDIQYSTDHGETWVDTAPADYDTVTDVRYYVNGNPGLWATETLKPEVIDPLVGFAGTVWQNGGNGNDDYDQYIDVAANTNLLEDNYEVGFTVREAASWSDHRPNYEGSCRMPVDDIRITTPQQYEAVDTDGRVPYQTYLMRINKDGGAMDIGLAHPNTRLTDYDTNDWGTFFLHYITYPKTQLSEAVTAAAVSVYLDSVAGMTAGNHLYIGNERLHIVSIGEQDAAHGGGYLVIVDRGRDGTTAAAHADNAQVRAIVNKDAVRYILVNKRRGLPDRSWIKPWRVRKRGAA